MWWFVPTVILIGVLLYHELLFREHARSERITRELADELMKGREQ